MAQKQVTYTGTIAPVSVSSANVTVSTQGLVTAAAPGVSNEFGRFLSFRGRFNTFDPTVGPRTIFAQDVAQSGFITNFAVDGTFTVPLNGGGRYYVDVYQHNYDFGGADFRVNGVPTLSVNTLTGQVNVTTCQGFLQLFSGDTVEYYVGFGNPTVPTIQFVMYSCF